MLDKWLAMAYTIVNETHNQGGNAMNRYYSKLRPVSLGTFPKNSAYVGHHNFDDRKFCDDIEDYAWGYVEYSEPLAEKDIEMYDLADASMKKYYGVLFRVNNATGRVSAKLYNTVTAAQKPDNKEMSGKTCNTMLCWYNSIEEATKEMEDYTK